jgi:hypothetical protein
MSSVSEDQSHSAWSTTGYGQSRPYTTSPWRQQDVVIAPRRKK